MKLFRHYELSISVSTNVIAYFTSLISTYFYISVIIIIIIIIIVFIIKNESALQSLVRVRTLCLSDVPNPTQPTDLRNNKNNNSPWLSASIKER